ncbi:MAG: AbrB/MazE/SpoVT family DNA-binding domain-containing protein [Patescibacteria group bacterium]
MSQMATITSKKQLTLPAELFRKAGFRIGERVIVSEENGSLKITSAERLVEELAGSVPMPKKWRGKDIDEIIEEARNEYFSKKYQSK